MSTKQEALEKIAERLSLSLGRDKGDFKEETRFEDLNLKSVNYSQITTYLEDHFDIEVPFMDFKRCKTLGEAADYIVKLYDE